MSPPKKITVVVSGSGSNLQALIDAANTSRLPNVQFVRVLSDRKDAFGLQRAGKADIQTKVHSIVPYKHLPDTLEDVASSPRRKAYDADLAKMILQDQPDIVIFAGFMRIVTPSFLAPLAKAGVPIINLHPSLHGDLVGAHCIEDAWEEFRQGRREKTGVMVHYVIEEVDLGEPILQREVLIEGCGSLDELKQKIHATEHPTLVEATRLVLERQCT